MNPKDKGKIDSFLRSQLCGQIIGAAIATAAILLLTSGKKADKKAGVVPNYNDSIAAFDAKMQPRIDSLRNKIRSAMSEEEIDYADFGELIRIDMERNRLVQRQKQVADSLARVR